MYHWVPLLLSIRQPTTSRKALMMRRSRTLSDVSPIRKAESCWGTCFIVMNVEKVVENVSMNVVTALTTPASQSVARTFAESSSL